MVTKVSSPGSAPILSPLPRNRSQRIVAPLVTGGSVAALTVALHFRDPHQHASWGLCPWLVLTGYYCPGCGGLRAVNDLTDGHVRAALSSNLLFVVAIPALLLGYGLWLRAAWNGPGQSGREVWARQHPAIMKSTLALVVVAVVAFTVVRNLPGGSWLAP